MEEAQDYDELLEQQAKAWARNVKELAAAKADAERKGDCVRLRTIEVALARSQSRLAKALWALASARGTLQAESSGSHRNLDGRPTQ